MLLGEEFGIGLVFAPDISYFIFVARIDPPINLNRLVCKDCKVVSSPNFPGVASDKLMYRERCPLFLRSLLGGCRLDGGL